MGKFLEAKINYDNYDKNVIRTVEAHTMTTSERC